MKRKIVWTSLLACLLLGGSAQAQSEIKVIIEGEQLSMETAPLLKNDTTLVPFRAIFEKLGLKVEWEPKTKKITAEDKLNKLELQLNVKTAKVNGQARSLDVAPELTGDHTMVPLRFVSEALGKRVIWKQDEQAVYITKGFEWLETSSPFGGESYIELSDVTNFGSRISPTSVYEQGDTVYVLWARDETIAKESYKKFYLSAAKKGVWQFKASPLIAIKKDSRFQNLFFVQDNAIYWRDTTGVKKITFNEFGGISGDTSWLVNIPVSGETEAMLPLRSAEGNGFLLVGKTQAKAYIEADLSNPLVIPIIYGGLNQSGQQFWLNKTRDRLNLIRTDGIRQINTMTGDYIYDGAGKEQVTKISPGASTALAAYFNEKYFFLYSESGRSLFGYMDGNMNRVPGFSTNYKYGSDPISFVTQTDDEIHLWINTEFEKKPALQMVRVSKPVAAALN